MTNIYDKDTSDSPFGDTETALEKLMVIIDEYQEPFNIKQLRLYYYRKHGVQMPANHAGANLASLLKSKKIKKISRGKYASLNYKNK